MTADLLALAAEVRAFLRRHPGASRRQLFAGVSGSQREILAAFEILEARGEAEYIAPDRPGQLGQCRLVEGDELWVPDARCPGCHRVPPVRFTGREVRRARRERQTARLQTVRCPHCRTTYWIQARDVAAAALDTVHHAA